MHFACLKDISDGTLSTACKVNIIPVHTVFMPRRHTMEKRTTHTSVSNTNSRPCESFRSSPLPVSPQLCHTAVSASSAVPSLSLCPRIHSTVFTTYLSEVIKQIKLCYRYCTGRSFMISIFHQA
jgi:hypothetical protein